MANIKIIIIVKQPSNNQNIFSQYAVKQCWVPHKQFVLGQDEEIS